MGQPLHPIYAPSMQYRHWTVWATAIGISAFSRSESAPSRKDRGVVIEELVGELRVAFGDGAELSQMLQAVIRGHGRLPPRDSPHATPRAQSPCHGDVN